MLKRRSIISKILSRGLVFYLIFISGIVVYAQQAGNSVSGSVKNKINGEALNGVNILIYKDSVHTTGQPLRGTTTNKNGYFNISQIRPGTYFLFARNLGFRTFVKEITIGGETNHNINIEMTPEDIRLQEVLIKAEKDSKNIVSAIDVSPEFLSQMPSLSGEVDLFKTLQLLPGITTNNELSMGLYVRGGTPDQTLTMVDGVTVYNPTHLGNFASTFNSDALKNVRLIKGAFPAEYGGRLSSILDIKLKDGSTEKHSGVIGIGLINSRLSWDGPLTDNSTYMFSVRKMYYDLYEDALDIDGKIPRYNFYDMNTKLSFNANARNTVSFSAFLSKDRIYSPKKSVIDYDIGWNNATLSLNWQQMLAEERYSNTTISYINYKFKSVLNDSTNKTTSTDYFSSSQLQDIQLKKDLDFQYFEDNAGKIGIDMIFHSYDLSYSDVYSKLLEISIGNDQHVTSFEASGFIQSEWQIDPLFRLNTGGRFYYFNEKKTLSFEPRISALWNISENTTWKAAYAVAHQYLHLVIRDDISLPTDLWYPSTRDIEPGVSTQYVMGLDNYFHDKEYMLSVEGYYKYMDNLYEFSEYPVYNPQSSIIQLFTKGEGEAYGLEFFLNKSSGKLTGWLGYTLSWTKRKFNELNMGQLFAPRFDRRNDISLVLAYALNDNISCGLTWTYATGQGYTLPSSMYQIGGLDADPAKRFQFDYTERDAYKIPDYHKMDLNITYKFLWGKRSTEVYLNILNVYNRKNPFAYYAAINSQTLEDGSVLQLPKFYSVSLFPFIPTFGINIKF